MKYILVLLFISNIINAAVWDAKPGMHWDAYWEKEYSEWIKNDVEGNFFKKLGGAYKELPLDCADAAYGLRIYFSYKHSLPWKSGGAKWNNYKGEFSNDMTEWDHLSNPDNKVAALIDFLLDRVGTHSMAGVDSYSISFENVKSGDVFMYKYCKDGSCTHHTYIIKDINANGTFDVLYGTQNRAKKKWPLGRNKKEYLQHKPDYYDWGFKRFKTDLDIKKSSRKILENNDDQYEIAKRLTEDQFFDYVNASVRIIEETPSKKIGRLTESLCYALQARNVLVGDAIKYMNESKNGGQCMNEATFDIYSTPSRDSGIYKQYMKLNSYVNSLTSETKVNAWMLGLAKGIFNRNRSTSNEKRQNSFCKIKVSDGHTYRSVNLASFYQKLVDGMVSYHPNDNIFWRWGVPQGRKTTCHAWYTSELEGGLSQEETESTRRSTTPRKRRSLFDSLFGRN